MSSMGNLGDMGEALAVFSVFMWIYGVMLLLLLATFIVRGIGIYRMTRAQGDTNGWLGFIPIAAQYQLGKLAGKMNFGKRVVMNPGLWMALIPLIFLFGSGLFAVVIMLVGGLLVALAAGDSAGVSAISGVIMSVGFLVFYCVFFAIMVFYNILFAMAYFQIFNRRHDSRTAVLRMLICLYVPLADGILLIRTAKLPPLDPKDAPAPPIEKPIGLFARKDAQEQQEENQEPPQE